ncbi:formate dehydrogenase accessory protein FdhE [Paracoccus sp. S-4012]|uniref:formate dehydrogenase accessory protein FdhE n=1 Tax=Paracoccus sp. S-4012 TaxID=2665648 RepID=UPI0012B04184|nr:formate dehydrogenase accessory protein FdhE [Paracoccus sp. S-4012]MRX49848.1 formate dehydrogenase accessory protein FdhE [Paracoccus sp. S-4012]
MSQQATNISGGVPTPVFAFLPVPADVFSARAARFRKLAAEGLLAPYLAFLADLSALQAGIAAEAEPLAAPATKPACGMPHLDRARLAQSPELLAALDAFLVRARRLDMPAQARLALDALAAAEEGERRDAITRVLSDEIPGDSVAAHLFAAAAMQVELARRAAGLEADALTPVAAGTCPACGGKPVASVVAADLSTVEGTRYACCASCATRWNEVRIKCLNCGSLKGITYRALEAEGAAEPAIKAEACHECGSWLKIMHQIREAGLDPVADDVASLGLDLLMRETDFIRAGFHPFLAGY